ncbi:MAG: 50S ribosomal protein L9, partial [Alphaproteobacteria bacterium]
MEVILLERVEKLGQMGDVVRVKPGFARNYLLPEKKALRATKENIAYFETQRTQLEAVNLDRRKEAETVGQKLDGLDVTLIRQAGDTGQLYGSVTTRDIADALIEAGFTVARRQIDLNQLIKTLGITAVAVALQPEVQVT